MVRLLQNLGRSKEDAAERLAEQLGFRGLGFRGFRGFRGLGFRGFRGLGFRVSGRMGVVFRVWELRDLKGPLVHSIPTGLGCGDFGFEARYECG